MTCEGLNRSLAALNREWADLTADTAPVPVSWRLASPFIGHDATLVELLDRVRAHPDAVLLALLRLHHTGDALAGRAVVQAMLGKLVIMASRDATATFDDYLAALWLRVATYPLERRPRRVAANLALDSLKAVKSAARQPMAPLPPQCLPDPLGDAEAVLDAGVRLGVIDATTRTTMATVYVEGRTSAAAAAVLGVSADAVRWRCSKGVRALRAVAGDLVEQLAG